MVGRVASRRSITGWRLSTFSRFDRYAVLLAQSASRRSSALRRKMAFEILSGTNVPAWTRQTTLLMAVGSSTVLLY